MKHNLPIFLFLFFSGCASAPTREIDPADFHVLAGNQWVGTLTYLDYGNGRKTSIASTLVVTQSSDNKLKWIFNFQYPDEPKANQKSDVMLAADGGMVDSNTVVEKKYLPDGTLKFVTERNDKDNNKAALLRYTYLYTATKLSIKKEVKYEGASDFIERNEYSWKR
ncbi:MAG: hypothetical protein WCC58_00505 [Burkholderiales bacterium]